MRRFRRKSEPQSNAILKSWGHHFIGPEEGMPACGYEGVGRLWPVEGIVERAMAILAKD